MRQHLTFAFGVIALFVGIAGLAAHYYPPGSLYTLALSAFSAYLGLGALVAALLFASSRTTPGWIGCGVSVIVTIWLVTSHAPHYIAQTAPTAGASVVVMTSNLKIGSADPAAVVNAARTRRVDVLMLEELTPEVRDALRHAGLDTLLPHSVADAQAGGSGTGLWCRCRLTAATASGRFGFAFVSARTELAGQEVALAAVHVYGPTPTSQFPQWHDDMAHYPAALGGLPSATVLVGGDFNATLDTSQFRDVLAHGFTDAADQAGAGSRRRGPRTGGSRRC